MTIQYCSDLHLEFKENAAHIKAHPLKPTGEILVLAGDIVPLDQVEAHHGFFDAISRDFREVYWLPGNHEFYHNDISLYSGEVLEEIRSNVYLVNNTAFEWGSFRLIFSTMWSQINLATAWQIERSMNDFHLIKNDGQPFTTQNFNDLHKESLTFLDSELAKEFNGKTVVITHHVPTLQHYPEEYKGGILNQAFAVDLDQLIEKFAPDYWIFGHHHRNVGDFKIGETQMLTNQLGYVHLGENRNFDSGKLITV
ncbi:metallophosphoesterase [Mucilaginibacter lappiensis]|uniref:metallophosphoesterase n=1 Tax=Mucilaginibacter lappiensis TaxID=354630 RepID=UPI003D1DD371